LIDMWKRTLSDVFFEECQSHNMGFFYFWQA
jgi:hypothetical protein